MVWYDMVWYSMVSNERVNTEYSTYACYTWYTSSKQKANKPMVRVCSK